MTMERTLHRHDREPVRGNLVDDALAAAGNLTVTDIVTIEGLADATTMDDADFLAYVRSLIEKRFSTPSRPLT